MRRIVASMIVGIVGILGFVVWDGMTVAPKAKLRITKHLIGSDAEAYLQKLELKSARFRRHVNESDGTWGAKGKHRVPDQSIVYLFSVDPGRSWLQRMIPRLHAQQASNNDGYAVYTAYGGNPDGSQYNGGVYIELYNDPSNNMSNDWTITDTLGMVWVGQDRGDLFCHTRQICGLPRSEGTLSRLLHSLNPVAVAAACGCSELVTGRAGNCVLKAALLRAQDTCAGVIAGCKWSGPGVWPCAGELCTAAIYVYAIEEFVGLVSNTSGGC